MRRRQLHQGGVADCIDELSLLHITVRKPGESHAAIVVDNLDTSQIEDIEGNVDVTEDWASPDQTGSLGSDQRNPQLDVVTIVLVREVKLADLAVSNCQCKAFTRCGSAVASAPRWGCGALQPGFLYTCEFRRSRRHRGAHLAGCWNWGERWLSHTSRLSLDGT